MFYDYGDYYQDDDVIDDSDDTFDDDNTNGTARTYKKKKMTNHNSCVANIPMAYILNKYLCLETSSHYFFSCPEQLNR